MKFVDVTNDIAFRKIFGNENKKKSLVSFLNAVINLPKDEQIVDVEITNPYQLGKLSGGKSTIVDVKAKDKKGNTFIVEMQVAEFDFFHKRILYYTSQSYVSQIDKGIEYLKLKPVYFIGILEFDIGQNPSYFTRHKVLDIETKEQVIQDVEFNFIELPKFNKTIDQLETSIDQWTYFIKNAENLTVIPDNVKDEGLKEAYTEADKQNWTKQELEDYERASIKERDEIGRMEFAVRKAVTKAVKEAERKSKLEVAKLLRQKGVSIDIIIATTGLTKEEIERL
jgi:predicted transposase/invertase (TIGR01784 family)